MYTCLVRLKNSMNLGNYHQLTYEVEQGFSENATKEDLAAFRRKADGPTIAEEVCNADGSVNILRLRQLNRSLAIAEFKAIKKELDELGAEHTMPKGGK